MKTLLKFELYKIKSQKSIYICSAAILASLILADLAGFVLIKALGDLMEVEAPAAIDIVLSAVSSSNFTLITGIFIALYVCGDYSQQTIKNIYSRGFSRSGVYFSKLIICVAYVLVMFAVTELLSLALGSALYTWQKPGVEVFSLIFGQLLVCIAYAVFVYSVANMIKKTGIVLAVVLIAPSVLTLVLALIDAFIGSEKIVLSKYWLDGILTVLADTAATVTDKVVSCILPVVYAAGFLTAGYFVNRKTEV